MNAILTGDGAAGTALARESLAGTGRNSVRGLFAMLAQRLGERVTLPQRELPPEWFRFPLP